MIKERLKKVLVRYEGFKFYPYIDTVGKITIGIGRNLSDVGITEDEAFYLLENDIKKAEKEAKEIFPEFDQLNDIRQEIIINMLFNLGKPRFLTFKKFIQAVKEKDFKKAAQEMLNSKWAKQVKNRAKELAYAMENGKYPFEV